ncbi:indolepyruvate oxidoreductase subunit beta family protein [Tianweitania sp. BSSL-BM11]|uniref:Indolepyruvate oxidoreductase subunit beta family protein n=1 Tax=Tianweitania aestuarii TaxID=2814886 RepID=A0ABS5RXW8_9HYPH|nr:indolepyruvate oxidoreductase subunit beta family protein [Tianweitania aestuarii]MBS9721858.1 indolepyruvate oxidoreductase subunit beta family protein [Tianweitania aestuarii]
MKDDTIHLPLAAVGPATERPISIAIVAMGGQGGGVLTDWIVKLAEDQNWVAQSTSVPGVAQRTGATIYYVEMMPPLDGRKPILAQMPTPGDVDVVIASEFMEAGRSILRGIVTPKRTTLIASNHRSLSVTEKIAPGEGIADNSAVTGAIGVVAKREIVFNMEELAVRNGSVISSAMFGALAASGALPFAREAYLDIIRKSGKGVEGSIRTFEAAMRHVEPDDTEGGPAATELPAQAAPSSEMAAASPPNLGPSAPIETPAESSFDGDPRLKPLLARIQSLPVEARAMADAGLRKVVDYQDVAYGAEYLDLLDGLARDDAAAGGGAHAFAFTTNAAKYLANAMCYDDVIRVADLKTRMQRRDRIEKDMGLRDGQVMQTTEFMHPRMEEVNGLLPAGLGRWIEARPKLFAWLDKRVSKGRRVKTYSLPWFAALYIMGGMRFLRRRSLRHQGEVAHRDQWLATAQRLLNQNYALAVEVLQFQRLVKGYSDTHARGMSKFDKVMSTVTLLETRDDAADWARRLRDAAVKDGSEKQLDGTIATIRTFV